MSLGLIGLGLMGSAMHHRLLEREIAVIGYDVVDARRDEHRHRGGPVADSIAELADRCAVLLLSLPNSDIGREVCLGVGGLSTVGRPDSLVIDTTTARPSDTLTIATGLAESRIGFIDATLSGNAAQAATGDLVAMVGGISDDVQRARPFIEAFTRSIHHLGPVGAGARAKLIVNQVLGIHRVALAEGLVMGELAGIDLEVLLDVLRDGAAYSRAMDIWGERMTAGDHEPPASRIRQSHKDFRLILDQGTEMESPMPLASVVEGLLDHAEQTGMSDLDNSAVIEILRRKADIGRIQP